MEQVLGDAAAAETVTGAIGEVQDSKNRMGGRGDVWRWRGIVKIAGGWGGLYESLSNPVGTTEGVFDTNDCHGDGGYCSALPDETFSFFFMTYSLIVLRYNFIKSWKKVCSLSAVERVFT